MGVTMLAAWKVACMTLKAMSCYNVSWQALGNVSSIISVIKMVMHKLIGVLCNASRQFCILKTWGFYAKCVELLYMVWALQSEAY